MRAIIACALRGGGRPIFSVVAPLTYTLSPRSAPDDGMDDYAGEGAGATISTWSPNGGRSQQWIFIPR
jgi:hypothetical protein